MLLKIPWIDRSKCALELPCPAARGCKQGAMVERPESEETGKAVGRPVIDLEKCKRCGDCEPACPPGAVKML